MGKFKDLSGLKFNYLTVISKEFNRAGKWYWLCKCDCGKKVVLSGSNIVSGHTKSCGCYKRSVLVKHGKWGTRLYKTWDCMKSRCNNPKATQYTDYGGRGISVCKEWNQFENFRDWALSNGYCDGLTIDRIDVNGNYEPNNCKWATRKEQSNNMRTNRVYTLNGETKTLKQWCDLYSLKYHTILCRVLKGWPIEKALWHPIKQKPIDEASFLRSFR